MGVGRCDVRQRVSAIAWAIPLRHENPHQVSSPLRQMISRCVMAGLRPPSESYTAKPEFVNESEQIQTKFHKRSLSTKQRLCRMRSIIVALPSEADIINRSRCVIGRPGGPPLLTQTNASTRLHGEIHRVRQPVPDHKASGTRRFNSPILSRARLSDFDRLVAPASGRNI